MKTQLSFARSASAALISALLISLAGGCASKKKHGMEGYHSMIRAQEEAMTLQLQGQPAVFFRGPVQKPIVIWRENLTLAEALLEAGYVDKFSPHSIRISRQGQNYNVNVQRLLRGSDNPLLEPGDVVEVTR
jgi:hypothetical protein